MVAPSFLTAEAVTKYGKENIKVYLDDGRSTYTMPSQHAKEKKVRLVCEGVCVRVCVGGGRGGMQSLLPH